MRRHHTQPCCALSPWVSLMLLHCCWLHQKTSEDGEEGLCVAFLSTVCLQNEVACNSFTLANTPWLMVYCQLDFYVCSKMFIHLRFKWSNNSSFLTFFGLYTCSLIAQNFTSSQSCQQIFRVTERTFNFRFFLFSPVKPKIPDHKTAGHVNSRPIQFSSLSWRSRVVPAISTVRTCSVWKHTRRFFFFKKKTCGSCSRLSCSTWKSNPQTLSKCFRAVRQEHVC